MRSGNSFAGLLETSNFDSLNFLFFQSFIPGATQTKMLPESFMEHGVPPDDVVASSLSQLGWSSRTFGHWRHALAVR